MKSILAIMICVAGLSLCNLTKQLSNSGSNPNGNAPTSNTPAAVTQAEALNQILEVEHQWKDAKMKGDTAVLERVFADEFTNTDQNGKTYTKAEWIAALAPGSPTFKTYQIDDAKIVSYGTNTATLTFNYLATYRGGKSRHSRDTDTFVNRDGRWQVVASQSTPLR
jgi:hypothetical protein